MTPEDRAELLDFWRTTLWAAVLSACVFALVDQLVEEYGPQPLWAPLAKQALHQVAPDTVQADAHGIEDIVGECLPR
jgi:hypothetical protein